MRPPKCQFGTLQRSTLSKYCGKRVLLVLPERSISMLESACSIACSLVVHAGTRYRDLGTRPILWKLLKKSLATVMPIGQNPLSLSLGQRMVAPSTLDAHLTPAVGTECHKA
jgi:hypothetical protein